MDDINSQPHAQLDVPKSPNTIQVHILVDTHHSFKIFLIN